MSIGRVLALVKVHQAIVIAHGNLDRGHLETDATTEIHIEPVVVIVVIVVVFLFSSSTELCEALL